MRRMHVREWCKHENQRNIFYNMYKALLQRIYLKELRHNENIELNKDPSTEWTELNTSDEMILDETEGMLEGVS